MRETTLLDDFKMYVLRSGNTMNQLIAINVGLFILFGALWVILSLFSLDQALYNQLTSLFYFPSSPVKFFSRPWTIITYQFMHAGPLHILFNMLVFLFAGRIFREYLGDKKLLSVYIIGGIAGALVFMAAYQFFPMFHLVRNNGALLGASACIMAVLVAVGTLLPRYTVYLILIGPVQLVYIVLFLIVVDFLQVVGSNPGGSFAHLGGALWGFAYIKSLQNGTDLGAWLSALLDKIKSLFTRKSRNIPKIGYYNDEPVQLRKPSRSNRITQEDVDAILDKIARSGYDSLNAREKDVLFRASKEN